MLPEACGQQHRRLRGLSLTGSLGHGAAQSETQLQGAPLRMTCFPSVQSSRHSGKFQLGPAESPAALSAPPACRLALLARTPAASPSSSFHCSVQPSGTFCPHDQGLFLCLPGSLFPALKPSRGQACLLLGSRSVQGPPGDVVSARHCGLVFPQGGPHTPRHPAL